MEQRRRVRGDTLGMRLLLALSPHVQRPDGRTVPLAARDALLLAWLALEGPTPRARLAQLLWPDSEADAARNALRQRLFQLRRQFGEGLLAGSAVVSLGEGVAHDLQDADAVLGQAAPDQGGEIAAWLELQRERRRRRTRQSLVDLADMAEGARDYADALSHAHELRALEPLSEEAHRRVIRLHYLAGDRAAALLAFDRCEQVLKHEVGAPPSPETLALLSHIEASAPAESGPRPHVLPASLVRPPRRIGRDRECEALLAAWAAGDAFLLLGESGMGKSRLLDDVAAAWPGTVVVDARPGDEQVPLALVARLVERLCAHLPALMPHEVTRELRVRVAPQLSEAPRPAGVRPTPRPLAPPLRAVLGLAAAASPLSLVFDDWQFADDASISLLAEVLGAPRLPGVRVAYASRTLAGPRADERIAALQASSHLRRVVLAPLALDDVQALVDTLQLGPGVAAGLAQALVGRVGGNPLHILESLRHMLEAHRPLVPEQVSAPGQVKQLVAARLAQLPDGPRQVLRLAAVAGADFSVELAEQVSGRGALALWDDWSLLEHMGLFDGQGIAHDLYAEAANDTLPAPIGRVLHGRVAAWLETRAHEPARLAAHWLAAGDEPRALPALREAAHRAWFAARAPEAFEFFRRASEIECARGTVEAAFALAFDNAEAMSEIGTPVQLEQCLALLRPIAHTEAHRLRVRFIEAVLRFVRGDVESGMQAVIALLSEAIVLGDMRVESECRYAIGNRAAADGRFDEALQHLAAAERLLRQGGDTRRANALAGSMAMVLGMRGQARLGIREHERLLPLLAKGDRATWTVATASAALQHAWQGDAARALAAAQQAIESVTMVSIAPPDTLIALRYTVEALRWCGRFDVALQACEAYGARLAQHGEYPRARETVAALYLHLGRTDLAGPLITTLKAHPPERLRERLRQQLLLVQAACQHNVHAAVPWPADAIASEDLALSIEWALWSGLQAEPPWPAAALQALWLRASEAELPQLERPLRFLVARRLLDAGDAEGAARLLPRRTAADELHALHAATPWAAFYGAQALVRAGEAESAHGLARAGAEWLQHAARSAMPEPFRDSFLQRHPLHRALLGEAAR